MTAANCTHDRRSLVDGKELLPLKVQSAMIDDVAFSPDCQWIATAGRDKSARVYGATTENLLDGFFRTVTSSPRSASVHSGSW